MSEINLNNNSKELIKPAFGEYYLDFFVTQM
jgi:hypothetical protein